MSDLIPLCLIRIWCRLNNSRLTFESVNKDRYIINPSGYFIELPDGSLSELSPKVTFPAGMENMPALPLDMVAPIKEDQGAEAQFFARKLDETRQTANVDIDSLRIDPLQNFEQSQNLEGPERKVLIRAIEAGLVSSSGFSKLLELRGRFKTVGGALVYGGICKWEALLAYCLDTRPASKLDPDPVRTLIEQREWELIGEILVTLGKIERTQLEYVLKLKREGSQQLGQILIGMGVCKESDVERCMKIQFQLQTQAPGEEIGLIGKLLVDEEQISLQTLEDALRSQSIGRRSLARILIQMGGCTQKDVDGYCKAMNIYRQEDIDENNFAEYLLNTNTATRINIQEAQRMQLRGRQVLGEILVSMGACSTQAIESAAVLQRQIRETHRMNLKKIGEILVQVSRIPQSRVDEAVERQSIGRQPFGSILVNLGYCTDDDVKNALDIQAQWRNKSTTTGDRLGELLVQQGVISETALEDALLEHKYAESPLGRVLVEKNLCTPDQIIETLVRRDSKRHSEFLEFVGQFNRGPSQEPAGEKSSAPGNGQKTADKKSAGLVEKLASWFRPKN